MVPGQDFEFAALAGGVPVDIYAVCRQLGVGGGQPRVIREVLAPAVEPAALAPDPLDDPPNSAVAAREQALDDAGLSVVIAEADRAGIPPIAADGVA